MNIQSLWNKVVESERMALILVLITCALVYITALILEHGFNVLPCKLCHYERIIFILAGIVSLLGLFIFPHWGRKMLPLLVTIFASGTGVALYHVGIQEGIFTLPSFCAPSALPEGLNINEIRDFLLKTPFVPCNEVTFSILGLSLSWYNALLTLVLGIYCMIVYKKTAS